jgi:hypothetical protein
MQRCPHCGHFNDDSNKFCIECGGPLATANTRSYPTATDMRDTIDPQLAAARKHWAQEPVEGTAAGAKHVPGAAPHGGPKGVHGTPQR